MGRNDCSCQSLIDPIKLQQAGSNVLLTRVPHEKTHGPTAIITQQHSTAHSSLQLYGKLKTTAVRMVRRSLLTLTLPSHLPTVSRRGSLTFPRREERTQQSCCKQSLIYWRPYPGLLNLSLPHAVGFSSNREGAARPVHVTLATIADIEDVLRCKAALSKDPETSKSASMKS